MGTRNRQRRAEKQRKRARGSASGSDRGARRPAPAFDPALVHDLLLSAAHAFREGDLGLGAALVEALDERPVGRREHLMVAEGLDGLLAEAVRAAWLSGWQPADLARLVDRKVGARHGRYVVDVIAADARRYAGDAVDPRWADQLLALGAEVWWTRGAPHVEQWAEREGVARAGALTCALEVLAVLLFVPSIPLLCDPPGEPRRGGAVHRPAATPGGDSRMLDRVRALLAKAESTTFAEEAEALTVKAQELMARHSIEEAMVGAEAGGRGSPTIGIRLAVEGPYASPKSMLLSEVAGANGCRSVWSRDLGFSTVFGFESDVEFVEVLYTSLLVQATSAMVAAGAQLDRHGRSRTRSFRQSFLVAYGGRIGVRLRQAREASRDSAADEYGEALLPVLADRSAAVDEAVDEAFPRLSSHSVSINNAAGWAAGTAAAELATLSGRTEVVAKPA